MLFKETTLMIRRTASFIILTILVLSATPLLAHDEYRIIGTISKLQGPQLQIKNKDGKTFTVKLNAETFIHRDKEKDKVSTTELKTGRSVVVDALGDSEADLLALEVRIVPTIAPSTK